MPPRPIHMRIPPRFESTRSEANEEQSKADRFVKEYRAVTCNDPLGRVPTHWCRGVSTAREKKERVANRLVFLLRGTEQCLASSVLLCVDSAAFVNRISLNPPDNQNQKTFTVLNWSCLWVAENKEKKNSGTCNRPPC